MYIPPKKAPWSKEDRNERLEKSSTCKMGTQVSYCPFTEISDKNNLRNRNGCKKKKGDYVAVVKAWGS